MIQGTAEQLRHVVATALCGPESNQTSHVCLLPRTRQHLQQFARARASLGGVATVGTVGFAAWPMGLRGATSTRSGLSGLCGNFAHPLPAALLEPVTETDRPKGPVFAGGTWVVDVTAPSRLEDCISEAARGAVLAEVAANGTLFIGRLSDTGLTSHAPQSQPASQSAVLSLPGALGSAQTLFLLTLGFQRLLRIAARNKVALLARVHYAALGLARADIRFFEQMASRSIAAFSRQTGLSALLLGDFGQVQDYADASVVLEPSQSCRLDLHVPAGRVRPVLMSILQTAAGAAALDIRLCAPNGMDLLFDTHGPEPLATLSMGAHCVSAAIAKSALPDKFGQRALAVGVAADTLSGSGPNFEQWSQSGNWELTVRNIGRAASKLTFVMDDKVPLKSSTAASLRLSRSSHWDAEMLDFVRPVFCDVQNRLAALARQADVLPDFVLRRRSDPLLWPMIAVSHGTALVHCPHSETEETDEPFDGLPGRAVQLTTVSQDAVSGRCLRVLAEATPATLKNQLATAFA